MKHGPRVGVLRGPSRPLKRNPFALLLVLVLAAVAGCSGTSPASPSASATQAQAKTPIVIGQTSVLSSLDPFKESWSLTAAGVGEYVFMLQPDGTLTSRFVDKLQRTDDNNWTMTVKEGPKFSDGSPVDAKALAEGLNAIQKNNPLSNASAGVITFTPEGTTLKARTERPTADLASILSEWSNVVFKAGGGDKNHFTGPYQVKAFTAKTSLELTPNTHYPDAERRPEVTLKAFPDVEAMKLALQSSSIDMAFTITPDIAGQLEGASGIKVKSIDAGYQYFGRPNLTSGPLADLKVRQALDKGLDRNAYVKALKGGAVATGTFARYYSFAGKEDLTPNADEANRILDEAGWAKGADGIRAKNGERLSVRLVTYPMRPDLSIIMQVMVSQLKELGIDSSTSVVDDIQGAVKEGKYDLALWAQHTAPTGNPSFFLNQFFRTDGAANLTGYSSPATDEMLTQLAALPAGPDRDALAVKVQAQIRADQAMLFLVDPQWHIGVTDRLSTYQPYCGDYFVVDAKLGLS
ncbi:MAG: ABC transporter substrate-binding protein [Propionibacteriaceae bacterium]|nr:ABC transporter substrate-binding protein [Propionibacteriaceae bacterium]